MNAVPADRHRPWSFAAGPALLPEEVLQTVSRAVLDWQETGRSVLELPFSSRECRRILAEAESELRLLAGIPHCYRVLFLQGGAYGHFGLLAMNLISGERSADYAVTGHWGQRAFAEAGRRHRVRVAADGAADDFRAIPPQSEWRLDSGAAYCHITTAETAEGLQYHWTPDTADVALVADMTADFLTRPIDVHRYGLIYASAQKNLGVAGLTVVIVREDLLDRCDDTVPAVFNYARQARADSRVNTPPLFAVYVALQMFQWLRRHGGLPAALTRCRQRSALLYEAIDTSRDFYRTPVAVTDRSLVNVRFHLPDQEKERRFLAAAERQGLTDLAGHPAVGGIRASLYNAMPLAGARALAAFMEAFAKGGDTRAGRCAPTT